MDTPVPDFGFCWSCQRKISEKTAVWISENDSVPCCRKCWREIPAARRLEIGLKFHDRSDRGIGVAETLDALRDLIGDAFGGYFRRHMDDENRIN